MKIISDTHLEFVNERTYKTLLKNILKNRGEAQYIALLGDIGNPMTSNFYKKFLHDLSDHHESVFLLAGNHEYYNGKNSYSMEEIQDEIEKICTEKKNIFFLNDSTHILKNGTKEQLRIFCYCQSKWLILKLTSIIRCIIAIQMQ